MQEVKDSREALLRQIEAQIATLTPEEVKQVQRYIEQLHSS